MRLRNKDLTSLIQFEILTNLLIRIPNRSWNNYIFVCFAMHMWDKQAIGVLRNKCNVSMMIFGPAFSCSREQSRGVDTRMCHKNKPALITSLLRWSSDHNWYLITCVVISRTEKMFKRTTNSYTVSLQIVLNWHIYPQWDREIVGYPIFQTISSISGLLSHKYLYP